MTSPSSESEETQPEESLPEESMVCPSCHTLNETWARTCSQCGMPLQSSMMLDPMGQIQSIGFAYQQATRESPKLITVVGIWLLTIPVLTGMGLYLGCNIWYGIEWSLLSVLGLIIPGSVALLSMVLLYQVTMNYIRKKKAV